MSKAGKASLDDFHSHKKALNKFVISQLLVSGPVLDDERNTSAKRTVTKALNSAKKPEKTPDLPAE